MMVNNYFSADV
jgi:hypothetical protein